MLPHSISHLSVRRHMVVPGEPVPGRESDQRERVVGLGTDVGRVGRETCVFICDQLTTNCPKPGLQAQDQPREGNSP